MIRRMAMVGVIFFPVDSLQIHLTGRQHYDSNEYWL